ncbi:hypothetical protein GW17_00022445 [Ensete ventricosum]|nr:hypothetical protein GW17_00022445 [Ensete ventricosum]
MLLTNFVKISLVFVASYFCLYVVDAGPPSPAGHLRNVFYRMGLDDKKDGPGAPGGQSWTVQWLKFDNSYFRVYAEKYAEDEDAFFEDYAEAHAKLSDLAVSGWIFIVQGISMDDDSNTNTTTTPQEPFVAAYYSDSEKRKKVF